ncbi:hypothetical protein [Halalkalibacter hemicellulosilyticus]|uniref:DUF5085 domain-containing protein n=1 Tax=Halalkalibacter hemicellulosilyticusJCM 9152 TaxID=1236971 RepID=W4QIX6_9BACI|nr:hypothetical protein [Halalkalibacter hemicellulosilyticus]GAE32070.1 hypothetical protein JCM9152_3586 [Halalkalibacter hemicellulosilyticusJCM 9152]
MTIEKRALQFDNLLVYEKTQLRTDWQEGFFMMEDLLLSEGIYKTGPVFFSVAPAEGEKSFGHFTYYLPINEAVRLEDEPDFRFEETFRIEDALVLRQANESVDFHAANDRVREYANEQGILLEDTFYCVLLEVYGDMIIDLYVPIQGRGE